MILIGLVLFVMSHSFQHLTGVEPCVKQTIHLNTPLFTGQILKLIQDDRKKTCTQPQIFNNNLH